MNGFTIRTRKTYTGSLGNIIDAQKNEIEPPCAYSARFERKRELVAQLADDALEIFGIGKWFGKAQFGARHVGRGERRQRLVGVAKRLIETQHHLSPKAKAQTAARLGRELRHALDANVTQGRDGFLRETQ